MYIPSLRSRFYPVSVLAAGLLATIFVPSAFGAGATGTGTAVVITPISIVENDALDFGVVTASGTPGTVDIGLTHTAQASGGVTLVGASDVIADFTVTGESSTAFSISVSASTTVDSDANSMVVDSFDHPSGSVTSGGGIRTFQVGGILHVGANQPIGNYTGTYTVTVIYE